MLSISRFSTYIRKAFLRTRNSVYRSGWPTCRGLTTSASTVATSVTEVVAVDLCLPSSGQKTNVKSAVLHGFGDASTGAYCAVVYLCIESEDGYRTCLVAAKTRVAPSTPMTIPRLELFAALILVRLVSAIREALAQVIHIEEVFCWTDSITVFYWIQSDREFKQIIQNRIDEIHKLTDVKSWRHCPGIENPADIASRGYLASELVFSSLWWKGPVWLHSSLKNYPKLGAVSDEELTEECSRELKKGNVTQRMWHMQPQQLLWPKSLRVSELQSWPLKQLTANSSVMRRNYSEWPLSA